MGSRGQNVETQNSISLQPGDEVYIKATPSRFYPDGEVFVIKTADGKYIYTKHINYNTPKIDTNSDDYKRALFSNNVKAKFLSDGKVTVSSGGLFSRKRTFSNTNSFENEVNTILDRRINYYNQQVEHIKQGRISQLQAEILRGYLKNKTKSDAMRLFSKDLERSIESNTIEANAALDMKNRLKVFIQSHRANK